jgi:hypothetical protein
MKMITNKYVSKNIYYKHLNKFEVQHMYMKVFLRLTLMSKVFLSNISRLWMFLSMHTQMYI